MTARASPSERGKIYAPRAVGDGGLAGWSCWVIAAAEREGTGSASARRGGCSLLVTFLDLWALGRHRLIDVGPLEAARGAEPGAGDAGPRTARNARSRPLDSGTCRCWSGRHRSRPIARSTCRPCRVDLADARAHERPGCRAACPRGVAGDRDGLRVFDPVENRTDQVLGREGERSRNDRGSGPGQLALRRRLGGRAGAWARTFSIWRAANRPGRAWFVP